MAALVIACSADSRERERERRVSRNTWAPRGAREDKFKNLHYTGKVGLCRDQFLHLYDIEIRACTPRNGCSSSGRPDHPSKSFDFRSKERKRIPFARQRPAHPFPLSADFLRVWPRLNYRKPCFDWHRRIPISRRVAHVAGTSYGVSRILYEFLSWSDSFICLSSIPLFFPLSSPLYPIALICHFLSPFSPTAPLFSRSTEPSCCCCCYHPPPPPRGSSLLCYSRTPGLAGRQSQLRSWFKVGARTKYGSISS